MLIFAGQEMVGGCTSVTVTVKLQSAVLPALSVALQVTVDVPEKLDPLAPPLCRTTLATVQLSVAVGVE